MALEFTGIEHTASQHIFCYGVQPLRSHELPVGAIFEEICSPYPTARPGDIHAGWYKNRWRVVISEDHIANLRAKKRGERNPQYMARMYHLIRQRPLNTREVKSYERMLQEERLAGLLEEMIGVMRSAA